MAGTYLSDFYDQIRHGCQQSAELVVSTIYHDLLKPYRVVDIGCGEGWWANKFKELGSEVHGIDGAYVASSPLGEDFTAIDIDVVGSLSNLPISDLTICLEVAEHLPSSRAESFISELCKLAPTILFSAAIPNQPGAGHINCQWPSYWAGFFARHGFSVSGNIRDLFWDDEKIEPWYRQNLLIISNTPERYPNYFPDETELNRTHPIIASWMK